MGFQKHDIKIRTFAYVICAVTCIVLLIIFIGFPQKYNWDSGKTSFSVFYSSVGTMHQGEINIKINENGQYEFIEYAGIVDGNDRKVIRKYAAKLTDSEMEKLFDYMINKTDFFEIRENISIPNVSDASYDYLEVKFNDNIHRIGGYAASLDKSFIKASKKLFELDDRLRMNR